MKPSPAGKGKYRLREFASGSSNARQRGFQILRIQHHQCGTLVAVGMQRGAVEPTIHGSVIEGTVIVAVVLKCPAEHITVERPGPGEILRR